MKNKLILLVAAVCALGCVKSRLQAAAEPIKKKPLPVVAINAQQFTMAERIGAYDIASAIAHNDSEAVINLVDKHLKAQINNNSTALLLTTKFDVAVKNELDLMGKSIALNNKAGLQFAELIASNKESLEAALKVQYASLGRLGNLDDESLRHVVQLLNDRDRETLEYCFPALHRVINTLSTDIVTYWSTKQIEEDQYFGWHFIKICALAFSPDSSLLASGATMSKDIKLMNVATRQEIKKIQDPTQISYGIYALAFSPDGSTLVSGSDEAIIFWDVKTGALKKSIKLDERAVCLQFIDDNTLLVLAVSESNSKARLWKIDINTYGVQQISQFEESNYTHFETLSPDGKMVAMSANYGAICTVARWREIKDKSESHSPSVSTERIIFSHDNTKVASGSEHKIILADAKTGKELRQFYFDSKYNSPLAFSPDDKIIAFADDGGISLLSVNNWMAIKNGFRYKFGKSCQSSSFSPNGKIFAVGDDTGTLILWYAKQ